MSLLDTFKKKTKTDNLDLFVFSFLHIELWKPQIC